MLEVPKRRRVGGMSESESEVVECQCLGVPVTEVTDDGERGTMLFGRQFVMASTPKLRSELVEPERLALPVDSGWFPSKRRRGRHASGPENMRRARPQPGHHGGVAPTAASQEQTGQIGSDGCHFRNSDREPPQVLLNAELAESSL